MNKNNKFKKRLLSIVVPVFNESEGINIFYKRLRDTLTSLNSYSSEIIFVEDGSSDDSYQKLVDLANTDPQVKIVKFSRNFGHQMAITAGIDIANGDACVVIDADLQDPPEVIRSFIEKWEQGYDIVYGVRKKREGETKLKLLTASIFYRLLKRLTKIDIPTDVGDFRLISRRGMDEFKKLEERDRFVRGLVSWIGFKQMGVYYLRDKRYAGNTKYPYRKMFKFAIDGVTSFSMTPLKLSSLLGYFTSTIAFIYASVVFVQKVMGYTVQGWATIMVGILFLGGVQLICLGIIGEYIGRIFNEIKQRPKYIVETIYELENKYISDVTSYSKTISSTISK